MQTVMFEAERVMKFLQVLEIFQSTQLRNQRPWDVCIPQIPAQKKSNNYAHFELNCTRFSHDINFFLWYIKISAVLWTFHEQSSETQMKCTNAIEHDGDSLCFYIIFSFQGGEEKGRLYTRMTVLSLLHKTCIQLQGLWRVGSQVCSTFWGSSQATLCLYSMSPSNFAIEK